MDEYYVNHNRASLKQIFDKTNPDLVQLLEDMLEINPYFRPSAKQLLESKIFEDITKSNDDKILTCPFHVKIRIDNEKYGVDYEKNDFRQDL